MTELAELARSSAPQADGDPGQPAADATAVPVVLLVDDEPSVLSALKRLFRTARYVVLTAQSGAAALELLATTEVDLIVSDMRMPYMSGADFLAHAQKLYPDTMRILLTGYSEIGAVVRAINEGGIYRYLNKPWDDQDLLLTVAQALEQRRLRRETLRLGALTQKQNDELRKFNAGLEALVVARTEEAQRLARHDPLTGLYNRRVLSVELQAAIEQARSGSAAFLVMVIDLDRFKPVNDLRGHLVGDLVLCEIARRLTDVVRKSDTVSRLGGDEFAIVANAEPDAYGEAAMLLATRLLRAINEPIAVGEARIEVGASIGISCCPSDGLDAEGLLRVADIAMYRAKREARGSFRFFEPGMDAELRAQAQLEADVRAAVTSGTVLPHYQPLIDMRDNRLFGFEILARWRHPVRGWVSPDIFIPIAEQLGFVQALTLSLLRQACRDASRWPDRGIRLALNLSPSQLRDADLPAQLVSVLYEEGFSPSRLEVEITETALVGDLDAAKVILKIFRSVGIKVALDDFGTGYSSLYQLRELKFDKLKIDRSFIQSMRISAESEMIVDAILGLAKSLGMPTVAEGIEDPVLLQQLTGKGCEFGQGFFFGKAMSAESVRTLLEAEGVARSGSMPLS